MPKLTESHLLYEIARMYYIENMNQAEISRKLGISRPQVSRYLKKARESGLVEIKLNLPFEEEFKDLEKELQKKLGLKKVVIASLKNQSNTDEEEVIKKISIVAGRYIASMIKKANFVGLGWGRTVHKTILSIEHQTDFSETTFIPLIGGTGQTAPHYQVNTLVDRLAEKFGAKRVFLNAPAFLKDEKMYKETLKDERICAIVDMWKMVDLAIIGVGGPIQSSGILRSEISPEMIIELIKKNPVGDVLSRFFDSDGKPCNTGLELHLLGMDLEVLKKVDNVICVSGGDKKIEAITAAAKANYFNILLTDQKTAIGIKDYLGGR